jgi:diacylglycerol kinase
MDNLKSILQGFVYAFRGIIYIFKNERNARIHLLIAIAVLLLGWGLDVSNAELAAIFFAIIIVFLAEVVNTAIEKTLDLIDRKQNLQIAIIKDMAAGAVLVAASGAAIIGTVIFVPYIIDWLWR